MAIPRGGETEVKMPGSGPSRPVSSAAIDPQLLVDPIGFLQTELYRQRVACNTLEALACSGTNGDVRTDAERVLRYIVEDLPAHIGDLEECLFPALRRNAVPSDNVERLLTRYRGLRERRDEPTGTLLSTLRGMALGEPPPPDFQALSEAFVAPWRGDLAAEDAEILPLAERRLAEADLIALGQAMAHRRGISDRK